MISVGTVPQLGPSLAGVVHLVTGRLPPPPFGPQKRGSRIGRHGCFPHGNLQTGINILYLQRCK
ncbi:hypothetical protein SPHINGO391_390315 [Sphingomonas aurantiaca]|uniref:Uncharacterized protein n=1 Tax=Sphingomonas aurantiaca TaxID=185949 RepID=A0A5E7YYG9_9SPHN|nr:hypothetical protein SPHINGO391_390315 [Sphingomonas aurantiaca]